MVEKHKYILNELNVIQEELKEISVKLDTNISTAEGQLKVMLDRSQSLIGLAVSLYKERVERELHT